MRTYKQLTEIQRYQIYSLLKAGLNQSEVAEHLNVHKATISREIRRNKGKRGYRPKQAQEFSIERRAIKSKAVKVTLEVKRLINEYLRRDLSPEQVCSCLRIGHNISLSHETIYRYVLSDKQNGGMLYKHLRHRKKQRQKRYGAVERRGKIRNRTPISERPAIVEHRSRIGDWEMDLMEGAHHRGFLLVIVERKTQTTLIKKLQTKQSAVVTQAVIELLGPYKDWVETLTCDNGKEFSGHEEIAKALETTVYFCDPYSSWQRGLNGNMNGLIRQYFPKGCDFRNIHGMQVKKVMNRLNNRPRKSLAWYTPNELFFGIPFQWAT